ARQFCAFFVASIEIGARLLGERVEPEPRMLGIDRGQCGGAVGRRQDEERCAEAALREAWIRDRPPSTTPGEQILQPVCELRRHFAVREPREMQCLESFRYLRRAGIGFVDANGQDEEGAFGDVAGAIDRVTPLAPEVAFEPALGRRRDDRNEIRAARDVALDLAVIVIAALEALEIEPAAYARGVEARLELLDGGEIFAGVAYEHRVVRHLALRRQEALRRGAKLDHVGGLAAYGPAPMQLVDELARAAVDAGAHADVLQKAHQPSVA